MIDLNFPKVSPDEAEIVTTLAREIWPVVYADMISREQIDYMLEWMYSPEKIREEIRDGVIYLLIQHAELTAGFLSFGPVVRGKSCLIHKIYVAPEYHRQGFGKAALGEIAAMASAGGASSLELRVNRGNQKAIGLYQSTGFDIIAKDCADIGGGFVMDDYILRKRLQGTFTETKPN